MELAHILALEISNSALSCRCLPRLDRLLEEEVDEETEEVEEAASLFSAARGASRLLHSGGEGSCTSGDVLLLADEGYNEVEESGDEAFSNTSFEAARCVSVRDACRPWPDIAIVLLVDASFGSIVDDEGLCAGIEVRRGIFREWIMPLSSAPKLGSCELP